MSSGPPSSALWPLSASSAASLRSSSSGYPVTQARDSLLSCVLSVCFCWWLFSERGSCNLHSSLASGCPEPELVCVCVCACTRMCAHPASAWQALCGHVALSPSYLCGPPLSMAMFLVWWMEMYCGESRIYLVLGSSVLSKQQCPLLLHMLSYVINAIYEIQ